MLTRKQFELLVFIHERQGDGGVSPSFDEMKEALGLKSKSGIHRLISALEERGFIRRLPHRARAIEITKLPEIVAEARPRPAAEAKAPARFQPNVIQGGFAGGLKGAVAGPGAGSGDVVPLPMLGRIAAGTPIEALRLDGGANVDVPAFMLGQGEHYALEVAGDSMVEAGILDGDTVLIQRCDAADSGTIVVALVDENEVTLKRLRRKGAAIALEPANPKYETRIFGPDKVRVQGRLVGLLRRY